MKHVCLALILMLILPVAALAQQAVGSDGLRAPARDGNVPQTRWMHMPNAMVWNRAALSALKGHGQPLTQMVPEDVSDWCPNYPQATQDQRRGFWLGFMSALAKYESTYQPRAVGGGGRWFGLLQIAPATARGYGCAAGSGDALKNGAANLSCAVRIMAVTVPRDGVIAVDNGRLAGVSADWGPMHSTSKRTEMASWLKRQPYCKKPEDTRPQSRPPRVEDISR